MTNFNNTGVHLFVGTHKGGFRFSSDPDRKNWKQHGPFLKGDDVNHMIFVRNAEPSIFACVTTIVGASKIQISRDFGATWSTPESEIRFDSGSDHSLKRIWYLEPGINEDHNILYAGVDPAAIFKSDDGGQSWKELKGLTGHSTRDTWQPGMGGMMVHSICPYPGEPEKLRVGISAAGTLLYR